MLLCYMIVVDCHPYKFTKEDADLDTNGLILR